MRYAVAGAVPLPGAALVLPACAVMKLQNFPGCATIVHLSYTADPWPKLKSVEPLIVQFRK